MSSAHKATRLPIKGVSVPVPYNSAHFTFDEGLHGVNNGQLTYPEDDHITTLRPYEGKFGGAIAIEEGTTNLFPDLNMWTVINASTASAEDLSKGNNALLLVSSSDSGSGFFRQNYTQLGVHTLSVFVKAGSNSKLVALRFGGSHCFFNILTGEVEHKEGGIINSSISYLSDGWYRISATYDVQASISISIRIADERLAFQSEPGIDAIFWRPQLEQKAFATSFIDGNRIRGRLRYNNAIINPRKFTLNFWVYLLSDITPDYWRYMFDQGTHILANSFNLRFGSFRIMDRSQAVISESVSTNDFKIGEWQMITLLADLDDGVMGIFLDADRASSYSTTKDFSNVDYVRSVIHWGEVNGGNDTSCMLDNVLILPYAVDKETIQQWYYSESPFYNPYNNFAIG